MDICSLTQNVLNNTCLLYLLVSFTLEFSLIQGKLLHEKTDFLCAKPRIYQTPKTCVAAHVFIQVSINQMLFYLLWLEIVMQSKIVLSHTEDCKSISAGFLCLSDSKVSPGLSINPSHSQCLPKTIIKANIYLAFPNGECVCTHEGGIRKSWSREDWTPEQPYKITQSH